MSDQPNRPVARFFGGLLMAIGGLIAVTAGLCAVILTGVGLALEASVTAEDVQALLFNTILPCVLGVAIFFGGRALWRGPKPRS